MTAENIEAAVDRAPESAESVVARMAKLPSLEYQQQRKATAKELGIGPAALDVEVKKARKTNGNGDAEGDGLPGQPITFNELEHWPETINGAALLDEIASTFSRYVKLPKHAPAALALWTVHTHCFQAFQYTPRLAIASPEKRCGKTTVMKILKGLVFHGFYIAGLTPAVVFRVVGQSAPTLLADEGDTYLQGNDELRGVINFGYEKGGLIPRNVEVGNNYQVRGFPCFAPLALAGIGRVPDTILDRSVIVPMKRKGRGDTLPKFRVRGAVAKQLLDLARKAHTWAASHLAKLEAASPNLPEAINDRAADNWEVLLAIADAAGGHWTETARAAALALSGDETENDDSIGAMLLADLRAYFNSSQIEWAASEVLAAHLTTLEDRPWPEYGRSGKAISPRAIATILGRFEIRPRQKRQEEGASENRRGYGKADMSEAWNLYLPPASPCQPATPLQPTESNACSSFASATTPPPVAHTNPLQPAEHKACSTVADSHTQNGYEGAIGSAAAHSDENDERAAIMEFDGGMSRAEAEGVARKSMCARIAKEVE